MKVTVLSPHCDDASFSLGLALSEWGAAAIELRVLNFFTQSAYAPHSSARTIKEISLVRQAEDRCALAFVHDNIRIISLDLLDAPLRLHLPFSQITQKSSTEKISLEELQQLSNHIQQHCVDSLVIAPLGLGDHVDHIAVHKAAASSLPLENLAFYEDLPYATWTAAADLQTHTKLLEQTTGIELQPFILQTPDAVRRKRQIASFYRSQITSAEADVIAQYAESYGNGERLWLPAYSKSWTAIRLLAIKPPQTATHDLPR